MEVCYEMLNGSIYFADDMKKAYDIAVQYLPINSEIDEIEVDYNPRYGKLAPF